MTSIVEETAISTELNSEGGVELSASTRIQSKPRDEGDMEMFEEDDEDEADEFADEIEEGSGNDDDDDVEMSATLEQTDIAEGTDENIERASKALPQFDSNATWIPPTDSAISQNELYSSKPTPYTFDLGNLAVFDPNPLPPNPSNRDLDTTARSAAQAIIGQLLTTRPIRRSNDSVLINLPAPTTPLPREKHVPTPKPKTKWQEFAERKGIGAKKKGEGRMVFNEETQDWVPKWGYKGKNKEGEDDWLVEVDEKKEPREGELGDKRKEGRVARKERMKRNERKMRANERKAVHGRGLAS